MARTSLVVGVDAGGSSVAAVARYGADVVGKGFAGPANLRAVGIERAAAEIARAILEATQIAGGAAGRKSIAAVYVGAAGAGTPAAAATLVDALREALRNEVPGVLRIVVEDDARIALRSAIIDGPGIVLIAGTGSLAYGENGAKRFRAGGGGYLLGDEGSGFAIGLAAAQFLLRSYDGREPAGAMTRALEQKLALASRDDLLDVVYGSSPANGPNVAAVAALGKEMLTLAAGGEPHAVTIVHDAGRDLCRLVVHVSERLQLGEPRIALAGGLLHEDSMLDRLLQLNVHTALPGCSVVHAAESPAFAAARLAADVVNGST